MHLLLFFNILDSICIFVFFKRFFTKNKYRSWAYITYFLLQNILELLVFLYLKSYLILLFVLLVILYSFFLRFRVAIDLS